MAVGFFSDTRGNVHTLAEKWNGRRWVIVSTPKPFGVNRGGARLNAVSCATASVCTAVGTAGGATLVERWNGAKWVIQHALNPNGESSELDGVSCPSPKVCIAVGTGAEQWNGSTWMVTPTNASDGNNVALLSAVSCVEVTVCTAVGAGPLAESWNATSWTQTSPPPPAGFTPRLTGVSCPTVTFCIAVGSVERDNGGGDATYAYLWNGTTWTAQTPGPPSTGNHLTAVSCTSPIACTAVGDTNGVALVKRYS